MWNNPGETPGNGIDDVHNGYVDDVYGWKFLWNKNGENLKKENGENSRVYYRFKNKYENKNINADSLNPDERWQYNEWQKAAAQMSIGSDEQMELMMYEITAKAIKKHDAVLRDEMKQDDFTADEVEKFAPKTPQSKTAKMESHTIEKRSG